MLSLNFEKELLEKTDECVVGMDEAGRGPIAGPIAVGAVAISKDFCTNLRKEKAWLNQVNDSKKLSPKARENIFESITKCLPFSVGMASENYIDRHGISKATEKAAREAIKKLDATPGIVLIDGRKKFLNQKKYPEKTIVRGDSKIFSIACASIMAKVIRDRFMQNAHRKWPEYYFGKHKGYGTALHIKCLKIHGPCPLHRLSFAPLKNWGPQKSSSPLKRENGKSR